MSSYSKWIKLNVGGQCFQTTLTTLMSCPDSLLAKMFDPESSLEQVHSEDGVYFLDANPKYFSIILDWLRYKEVMADSDIKLGDLAKVANFFGLEELADTLKKRENEEELKKAGVARPSNSNGQTSPANQAKKRTYHEQANKDESENDSSKPEPSHQKPKTRKLFTPQTQVLSSSEASGEASWSTAQLRQSGQTAASKDSPRCVLNNEAGTSQMYRQRSKENGESAGSPNNFKPPRKKPLLPAKRLQTKSVKKSRRYRPGLKALRETRKFQKIKMTDLIIPKMSFRRLVKEVATDVLKGNQMSLKIQVLALECLQEAAETYFVQLFEDTVIYAKRKDMTLARRIRGEHINIPENESASGGRAITSSQSSHPASSAAILAASSNTRNDEVLNSENHDGMEGGEVMQCRADDAEEPHQDGDDEKMYDAEEDDLDEEVDEPEDDDGDEGNSTTGDEDDNNVVEVVDKPHRCTHCSKSFSRMGNLNLHRRIHTREKPYECGLCSKSFSQLGSLKEHRRIHTGEKPYKCGLCYKSFSRLGSLKQHRRIHTGEKPYECGLCSKSFSLLETLKRHKKIHSGEKPYKCGLCSKSFSLLDSLKRHKRIHTGEKPYECGLCSKSFSLLNKLKRHKMMHTQEKPQ